MGSPFHGTFLCAVQSAVGAVNHAVCLFSTAGAGRFTSCREPVAWRAVTSQSLESRSRRNGPRHRRRPPLLDAAVSQPGRADIGRQRWSRVGSDTALTVQKSAVKRSDTALTAGLSSGD